MDGLRGCLWLLGSFWLWGTSTVQAQSISPWQMHEGQGPIQFNQCFAQHGEPGEYAWASIPSMNDPGWFNAPSTAVVGLSRPSSLCGASYNCRCWGDYTYFRSTVTIPASYNLTRFEVELQGMDDGTRITIFNSAYPNGVTPPGAYVVLGQTLTQDLRSYARVGEANTVVLTHVDDCCQESNLHAAYIRLNGQAIPVCQPTSEVCDGQDNDCNGQIDEAFPTKGQACTAGVGICEASGTLICKPDGSGVQCSATPGPPSQEVCDNRDNDCNGQIDDNLLRPCTTPCGSGVETCVAGVWGSCSAPPTSPEVCDGKDNDCDGKVDNGLTRACSTICGAGNETCVNGAWVFCDAQKPSTELCDGKDNDCNGQIDDGIPPQACQGDCGQGTVTCQNGALSGCSGPTPEPEICDGKDNDCNGKIDDKLSRSCKTDCGEGTETCGNGKWQACTAPLPGQEVCDGKDNDCDGKVDNGATCPAEQTCDQGQCRLFCRNGECPRGALCVDRICQGDLCKNVTCPASEICLSGRCVDACLVVSCPQGHLCKEGRCIDPSSPQENPSSETPTPEGSTSDAALEGPSSETPTSESPAPSEQGNDTSPDTSGQTDATAQDGKGSGTGFDSPSDGETGRTPGGCLCSSASPLPSALFLLAFLFFLRRFRRPLSL